MARAGHEALQLIMSSTLVGVFWPQKQLRKPLPTQEGFFHMHTLTNSPKSYPACGVTTPTFLAVARVTPDFCVVGSVLKDRVLLLW
jgi:hypothetical protein